MAYDRDGVEIVKMPPDIRTVTGTLYVARQLTKRHRKLYTARLMVDGRIDGSVYVDNRHLMPCPFEALPTRLASRLLTKQRQEFRRRQLASAPEHPARRALPISS